MAKRRSIREEDAALWRMVVRDVVPLHADLTSSDLAPDEAVPEAKPAPVLHKKRAKAVSATKMKRKMASFYEAAPIAAKTVVVAPVIPPVKPIKQQAVPEPGAYRVDAPEPSFAEMMARSVRRIAKPMALKVGVRQPGLDDTSWKKLTRGTVRVEAKLDLHGYIVQEAFERLLDFLQRARSRNLKCIEVVTGLGSGDNSGAIRRELPLWLQRADVRGMILAVVHTHKANHGAVRILLKTRR